MNPIALVIALGAVSLSAVAVAAQPAEQAAAAVDGRAVAGEVKKLLNQHYVLPEARAKFAAVLDKGIASGRYDGAQAEKLVQLINADFATVTVSVSFVNKRSNWKRNLIYRVTAYFIWRLHRNCSAAYRLT